MYRRGMTKAEKKTRKGLAKLGRMLRRTEQKKWRGFERKIKSIRAVREWHIYTGV